MDITEAQKHWDRWGKEDPMFAIVTRADKRGNRWEAKEFFATGEKNIEAILGSMAGTAIPTRGNRALDFGCGLGRLTQALAGRYEEVHGVDIAGNMIEKAKQLNQHGNRVHYHVNATPDLARFPDGHFDLVFSFIVLQHIDLKYQKAYLREFLRIARPGGGIVFQVVEGRSGSGQWKDIVQRFFPRVIDWYRRRKGQELVAEMHPFPAGALTSIVEAGGGDVVVVQRRDDTENGWNSALYGVLKAKPSPIADHEAGTR
jgi:SAM-dependent methyltransferase